MKNDELNYVSLFARDSIVNDTVITVPSHLKIAGTVINNIVCKGKVVIAETGVVEGNIKAESLVLHGKLQGNVWLENLLEITHSGKLTGYVSTHKLSVKEGALCQFDAHVDEQAESRYKRANVHSNHGQVPEEMDKKATQPDLKGEEKKKTAARSVKSTASSNGQASDKASNKETDHFW